MLNIQQGISAVLKGKKKNYPQTVNRISALDEDCLRKLYYQRHDWDKKAATPDSLQGIFETGNILEPVIERIISEIGNASKVRWRVVGSQMPTNDNLLQRYNISGTIDGILQIENEEGIYETVAIVDIKTMSPYVFTGISDYDSLAKHSWTRKYRGQLMLYALAHNIERCCIIAINKTNLYDIKPIFFDVDMDYCERLLQKADAVNKAIKANTPPDGINSPDVCPDCPFASLCCPSYSLGSDLEISTSEELASVLNRLDELKEAVKEYNKLEKVRDLMLVKGQNLACDRFIVTWKEIEVSYKAKEASVSKQWRKKVVCSQN